MDNAPLFSQSPLGNLKSNINVSKWNDVMASYENKEYKNAMLNMIEYINPAIPTTYGAGEPGKYRVPHGSVIVNVSITDTEFSVNAPFIKLPEGGSVPILRQVAQLNFWPVGLANIILDSEDQLTFSFSCPLELCEPYKIYDVLREICINADRNDDLFITRFNAVPMREPQIERHSDEILEDMWTKVQEYINEAESYIDYFESKRWGGFVFDALILAFMKIDHYCAPQGYVRTQIEDHIDDLYSNRPFNERIHKSKTFLKKLKEYDKADFLDDVYKAEVFIPFKYRSDINAIRKNFQQGYNTAQGEMEQNNTMGATLTILKEFNRLFYYNNVDEHTAHQVLSSMERASGKSWSEAAGELWQTMNSLMGVGNSSQQQTSHSRSERY